MLFGWFDARAAKAFGSSLAHSFMAAVPAETNLTDKKFEAKARAAVNALAKQIPPFLSAQRLNAYQKAQLGNAFKWALKDGGYETEYVDKLTDWLLLQL